MTRRSLVGNRLWRLSHLGRDARFQRALRDPGAEQERLLSRCLGANRATAFGRRYGFDRIGSMRAYQTRVPLTSYEDVAPWIDRIRRGETGVLTAPRVDRLVPSSGSTSARKLVPHTRRLRAEFNRAIGPWIVDLFRARPALERGTAYWSISPMTTSVDPDHDSSVPVGFEDDGAYLGGWGRRAVDATLAVPSAVRHLQDMAAFRHATLLYLLRAEDLALVSVWHPSFLTLLLDALGAHWDALLEDLERGTFRPPGPARPDATLRMRPCRRRAAELRGIGPDDLQAVWPSLALISAWGDGAASGALAHLRQRLPWVEWQPKGLIATEAFVSLPYAGKRPLAVRSHVFEFLEIGDRDDPADGSRARWAHELDVGGEYSVVVTTAGGLYRYRLHDRVRVEERLQATPCLRFLGRDDGVVDLCGEKLADSFVAGALERLWSDRPTVPVFRMLAPGARDDARGYVLFVEGSVDPPATTAARLEGLLRRNPHYAWCAELGQLAPVRVVQVGPAAHERFVERLRALGTSLGDVKPVALDSRTDWEQWFASTATSP